MAPYDNYGSSDTSLWSNGWYYTQTTTSNVIQYVSKVSAKLWNNLLERDRYFLSFVPKPIHEIVRHYRQIILPVIRAYTLRINAAGRPGRRRRKLKVVAI